MRATFSRPSVPCDPGVRPNSVANRTTVSSINPRCFRSVNRSKTRSHFAFSFAAYRSLPPVLVMLASENFAVPPNEPPRNRFPCASQTIV